MLFSSRYANLHSPGGGSSRPGSEVSSRILHSGVGDQDTMGGLSANMWMMRLTWNRD